MTPPLVDGFSNRPKFCCMISGNKRVNLFDSNELYSERVAAIRWFERNAPTDFDLYGTNWDKPVYRKGILGKLDKFLWRELFSKVGMKPFPSYRGKIANKILILRENRFSICYENIANLPSYITEKIFDCFLAGCIPVYWGASNIEKKIPSECFIDRRMFKDTQHVYNYLKSISDKDFCNYQDNISKFLESEYSRKFSFESFAEIIGESIINDFNDFSQF